MQVCYTCTKGIDDHLRDEDSEQTLECSSSFSQMAMLDSRLSPRDNMLHVRGGTGIAMQEQHCLQFYFDYSRFSLATMGISQERYTVLVNTHAQLEQRC